MEEPDVRQGGGCEWISMPFVLDLTLRKPPADGTIRAQATDIASDLGRADRPWSAGGSETLWAVR